MLKICALDLLKIITPIMRNTPSSHQYHYLQRGMRLVLWLHPFHIMWGGYSHYLLSPGMPIWQSTSWGLAHQAVDNIAASYPWCIYLLENIT